MNAPPHAGRPAAGERRISVPVFLALVAVDLALIAVVGLLGQSGLDDFERGEHRTSEEVVLGLLLPVGASAVLIFAAVTVLGWWRPVLTERRPVQRWLWVVPIVFLIAVLLGIDYADLAGKSLGFLALLLLAALCVGFSEETLFRGIGVTAFRASGFSEGRVALWTSVVFGAAHLTNALGTGGTALVQAVAVSFAGYFFYLTRRVSGTLLVPAIVHALFDFSILSEGVAGDGGYAGAIAPILAYPVVGTIVLARRRRIEPRSGET